MASPPDVEELKRLLVEDSDYDAPENLPARSLIDLITQSCQTVVVEFNYIDDDYRAAYARFFYMRHHAASRRCIRLHLFGRSVVPTHLRSLPRDIHDSYLGFTVIRPLPSYRQGRSILSKRIIPDTTNGDTVYVTCEADYRANLAGNEIRFTGTPWMQQDNLVSACASASLWTVSYYWAHKIQSEFRRYYTPEITDMATRYVVKTGRAMPSEGLTSEQMMYALREMGYEPVYWEPKTADEAKKITYRLIESEVPVLVGFQMPGGGHVTTAVGHFYNDTVCPKTTAIPIPGNGDFQVCCSSEFANSLIVQDDAGGPFRRLDILGWQDAVAENRVKLKDIPSLAAKYGCMVVLEKGTPEEEWGFLQFILAPYPSGVFLSGIQAESRAIQIAAETFEMTRFTPANELVFRTYLQLSNKVKARFKPHPSIPNLLSREIRRHSMSKWVWITEIADKIEYIQDKKSLGHVILDSASHATIPDMYDIIVYHLPGLLALIPENKNSGVVIHSVPFDTRIPIAVRD